MRRWSAADVIKRKRTRKSFLVLDKWRREMKNFSSTPIIKWRGDLAIKFINHKDHLPGKKPVKENTIIMWFNKIKRVVKIDNQALDRRFEFTEAEEGDWRVSRADIIEARQALLTDGPVESAKPIPWPVLHSISLHLLGQFPPSGRRRWLNCMRGVLLSFTHVLSACFRSGDILKCFWRDIKRCQDENGMFLQATLCITKTSRIHRQTPIKKIRPKPNTPSMCPVFWFDLLETKFGHLVDKERDQLGTDPYTRKLLEPTTLTDGWRNVALKMGRRAAEVKFYQAHSGRQLSNDMAYSEKLGLPLHVARRLGYWTPTSLMPDHYSRESTDDTADRILSAVSLRDCEQYLNGPRLALE